ncbi:unnamed protein product, partial [Ectocarpus sp. 12 AP-2014]
FLTPSLAVRVGGTLREIAEGRAFGFVPLQYLRLLLCWLDVLCWFGSLDWGFHYCGSQGHSRRRWHAGERRGRGAGGRPRREDDRLQSRPGKLKRGGIAKALQRYSIWTAGSRQPNAESLTGASAKHQRTTSSPGTKEQCGGRGTGAPRKPPTRTTAGHRGKRPLYCQEDGCTRRPSYGNAPHKNAEFCSKHSKPAMVNVVGKRCGHPRCEKHPSYGKDGSKKAEFCAQHSLEGMANVVSKRCGHPGCKKHPSYGEDGSNKAEFCAHHRPEVMIDVVQRRCGHPGCKKQPSFGKEGSKKAEFCAEHS